MATCDPLPTHLEASRGPLNASWSRHSGMADSRRWNGSGVRRDDQFAAAWHGSGSRQVALAAGLAIAAGIAAVALMLLVAPAGGGLASQAPVGAEADDDAVDVGDIQVPAAPSDGNATSDLPLPDVPVP